MVFPAVQSTNISRSSQGGHSISQLCGSSQAKDNMNLAKVSQVQSASKCLHQVLRLATLQRANLRSLTVRASVAAPERRQESVSKQSPESLTITQPDDWHLHLRDGPAMQSCVQHSAAQFGRAIIMPNLKPPVVSTEDAIQYRQRILSALPKDTPFQPLMTLYLTDKTTADEIRKAKESGIVYAVKLYPAGATTNSAAGVTSLDKCMAALEAMVEHGLPLLVHGEVTDPSVDIFDRERLFLDRVLAPLLARLPDLRCVVEHATTKEAVEFVRSQDATRVGATVTPQHLLLNRNALFQGGVRPHHFCLPILKREEHREALLGAVTSGSPQFFLGTDSAPHERGTKEAPCGCAGCFSAHAALELYATAFEEVGALDKLEGFASFFGPDFYRLPRNSKKVTLRRQTWTVPDEYPFATGTVVPLFAGRELGWSLQQST
ncbi:Dihydroorotase [Klebsormidium nitens]|uniref:Dihydroorotase, mitochondrial n=1 Tax=Klebsormidium nitens TaxID=105231 RepID=A0A1Y1I877_KLENI|nr:Dihydroorotase [Klebsormidium nitens]|eukprot:GAQ86152.1 Dihydroorotase [Klebsormidium nitens]